MAIVLVVKLNVQKLCLGQDIRIQCNMGPHICFLFHNNLHHPIYIHNCCCRHRTIYLPYSEEIYLHKLMKKITHYNSLDFLKVLSTNSELLKKNSLHVPGHGDGVGVGEGEAFETALMVFFTSISPEELTKSAYLSFFCTLSKISFLMSFPVKSGLMLATNAANPATLGQAMLKVEYKIKPISYIL